MEVKIVKVGGRKYKLPFADLIPFDASQRAELRQAIEAAGAVLVPVVCWKEKKQLTQDVIVDGVNRIQIAAELGLKKVPVVYRSYESEEAAREDCERLNYDRRHLTTEQMQAQRTDRLARVAERRRQGESLRTIAEAEGISHPQVIRDLEAVTGTGVPVEPESGKITGQDGRQQPATKPKPAEILCGRCKRLGPMPDCEFCAEERKNAARKTPRQPGDDTGRKPDGPKNGEVLWDWKEYESAFGGLVRAIDRLGRNYRKKESPEAEGFRRRLKEYDKDFRAWHKALVKAHK